MELNGAKILYTIHTNIPLLGDFKITQTLVSTWIVMALLSGFAIWLGHDLKLENVSKRQAAAEFIVTRLEQFVHDNMGFHFDQYIPLVGAIFALSIGCNLISVVGLWSPTADLNTEAAWAIVVFVLIMYYKIKTNGILAYLKGLLDPIFIMAPINVLSEISTPVSMAFRHFGNILSGTVISTLLYWAAFCPNWIFPIEYSLTLISSSSCSRSASQPLPVCISTGSAAAFRRSSSVP